MLKEAEKGREKAEMRRAQWKIERAEEATQSKMVEENQATKKRTEKGPRRRHCGKLSTKNRAKKNRDEKGPRNQKKQQTMKAVSLDQFK